MSAAAPLSSDTEQAVHRRLKGKCHIKQAWGMSELSPLGTSNSDLAIQSGSVGQLVPSTYAKIIDTTTGTSLGPHQHGELVLKGPQVMMGYLDDPDKTNECLSTGGWLRTGDVAMYDENGYFYITDRIKELIKVNGYPVAPAELEALLLTHPLIADAAVISIPDEQCGELPRAYIVLQQQQHQNQDPKESINTNDSANLENDIYEWVKERVAPYKRLNGGIVLTTAIPKSASGKILRRLLKDDYNKNMNLN
jgi:4-coumarate--CoA ligase